MRRHPKLFDDLFRRCESGVIVEEQDGHIVSFLPDHQGLSRNCIEIQHSSKEIRIMSEAISNEVIDRKGELKSH